MDLNLAEEFSEELEERPIKQEFRGLRTNKSADTFANNGSRGKLNEDQLDERAKLHAQRKVNGTPNITDIAKLWDTKYNITMSISSESEWAGNNAERIDLAIAALEDAGDMPLIQVTNSTIGAMLAKGARNLLNTLRVNNKLQTQLTGSIKEFSDPYKMIGCVNKDTYQVSDGDQRKEFDKRLDHLIKLNNSHISAFEAVSKSTKDQGALITDMMKVVSELNKSGQVRTREIKEAAKNLLKEQGLKKQESVDLKKDNPLDPINDEERINPE